MCYTVLLTATMHGPIRWLGTWGLNGWCESLPEMEWLEWYNVYNRIWGWLESGSFCSEEPLEPSNNAYSWQHCIYCKNTRHEMEMNAKYERVIGVPHPHDIRRLPTGTPGGDWTSSTERVQSYPEVRDFVKKFHDQQLIRWKWMDSNIQWPFHRVLLHVDGIDGLLMVLNTTFSRYALHPQAQETQDSQESEELVFLASSNSSFFLLVPKMRIYIYKKKEKREQNWTISICLTWAKWAETKIWTLFPQTSLSIWLNYLTYLCSQTFYQRRSIKYPHHVSSPQFWFLVAFLAEISDRD